MTKRGTEFGIINFEDQSTTWKWSIFGEEYAQFKHFFEPNKRLFIRARVEVRQWWDKEKKEQIVHYEVKPMEIHFWRTHTKSSARRCGLWSASRTFPATLPSSCWPRFKSTKGTCLSTCASWKRAACSIPTSSTSPRK